MSNLKTRGRNFPRLVLVVDDKEVNRLSICNVLQQDYEVITAEDGIQALEQIRKYKDMLSLILLDIMMPNKNGLEVLEEIKQDEETAHIPVIMLTADVNSEVKALSLGAADFLSKGYQNEILKARVLRSIELSEDNYILQTTERDSLTGLYTREFFFHYAELHDQHYPDKEVDAVAININHFRMLNELYGKEAGDEMLTCLANRILSMLEGTEGIACRSEADNFFLYWPHREDYDAVLEQLYDALSELPVSTHIRLRMGVNPIADKSIEIERRFDRAILTCHSLRNRYDASIAYYDNAMQEKEIFSERLIADIDQALEEKQFKVYYQPKYGIQGDKPVLRSAEALIRWIHPEFGMVSPGAFIPLFEENGLIQKLDHYVWREAAAQVSKWKEQYGVSIPVSVNISRVDMYNPNLGREISELVKEFELSASDYLLEITESAYTDNADQIVRIVEELRSKGFQIEMDDFGSGYSSLNTLTTLPIDALKLDMKFIRNIAKSDKDLRMVELMMEIADFLAVPVIAEGVEDEEQYRLLREAGCDIIQGYYFSRPVPPEEFGKFIEQMLEEKA